MNSLRQITLAKKLIEKHAQIIIVHCTHCEFHKMTTDHIPGQYESVCNNIINEIKKSPLFCNWKIKNNPPENPPHLGQLDITVTHEDLNDSDKLIVKRIYSMPKDSNFPTPQEIMSKLDTYLYSLLTNESIKEENVVENINNKIQEAKCVLVDIAQKYNLIIF